jgi:hypothetical protein
MQVFILYKYTYLYNMAAGKIQNEADEKLDKDMAALQRALVNRLLRDLALISVNGSLVFDPQYFALLEDKIVNYMRELGYQDKVNGYLQNFDAIDADVQKFYSRQRLLLENEAINSPVNEQLRKQTIENLRGQGMVDAFVKPIADVMRVQALQGLTVSQATEQLAARITAGSPLTKYVGQVTQDALMQYDGALNENVKNRFGLKKFVYFSSVIETSRPICTHIKDKFGAQPISEKQLQAVLDEYCPSGVPSDEKITFTTVNNVTRTMKKGSGMIDGTTATNFLLNRGGYNCRHEVRYVVEGVSTDDIARALVADL